MIRIYIVSYYYLIITFLLPYYILITGQVTDRLLSGYSKTTRSPDFRFANG